MIKRPFDDLDFKELAKSCKLGEDSIPKTSEIPFIRAFNCLSDSSSIILII